MLIEVPEELERSIAATLGMVILRAKHARAACERMVTMLPLVIVMGGEPAEDEVAQVQEYALAISAQVVVLADLPSLDKLELHLKAARRAAELTRGE